MSALVEIVTNAQTGEVTARDFTPKEIEAFIAASAPTAEEQEERRHIAYAAEADPIFFKAQRGEATMDEWEAKVMEIKDRFPYPSID